MPLKGLAICRVKESTFICQLFYTSSNGVAPRIKPVTSHSAIKNSTDWSNLAEVSNH